MPTAARLTATQLEELLKTLLQALGCTGQCVYQWNGTNYELTSGTCTGIGCSPCPATMNGLFRALVLAAPFVFADPDNVQVSCTFVDLESSVLKALKDVALEIKKGGVTKKPKAAAPAKKTTKSAPAKKRKAKRK
jgi:hypothetical protein